MKKVVFICHGNMFRSPIAKGFYDKYSEDGSSAFSYGTHVAEQGHEGMKLTCFPELGTYFLAAKKYGIDIENYTCKQLKEEYLTDAGEIIVMAEKEYLPSYLSKYKYDYWEIPNPDFVTEKIAEDVISLIKEKVLELINKKV
ncbi:MAG: low molecular weight phosphatase family protein [bacterium]